MNELSNPNPEFIFHLVPKMDFFTQIQDNIYTPKRFSQDGFIHCTYGEDLTILVANDYFSKELELLILKISLNKVKAKVRFEAPQPIPGGKSYHLQVNSLYPHIYGSLNLDSIEGIAKLPKINYVFHFPKVFKYYSEIKDGKI